MASRNRPKPNSPFIKKRRRELKTEESRTFVSDEWKNLVECTVEVRRDGHRLRNGVVEAVSSDSSMMWLQFDGVHGRQLIMKTDPYEIYILN